MDKQRCIAAAAETEEDRLLLARLYEPRGGAGDLQLHGVSLAP